MDKLKNLLTERDWVLADGATGTNLFRMGLAQGDAPESWNLEAPERVLELHRAFLDAGADILLTNSFGGTLNRLKLHPGLAEKGQLLNRRAAELARRAVDESGRRALVAGSMGPTGDLYEPVGPLSIAEGERAFAEQAEALAEGGADVLWTETLSSLEEVRAALGGARRTGLPVVVTASFDSSGRTMMGLGPAEFAAEMLDLVPSAFGANCGTGTPDLCVAVAEMRRAAPDAVIVAKSNAGIPEFVGGEFVYSGTPEHMATYARLVRDAGANIIGGCCGTTPEHLRAMRDALASSIQSEAPDHATITRLLGAPTRAARPGNRTSGRRSRRSHPKDAS